MKTVLTVLLVCLFQSWSVASASLPPDIHYGGTTFVTIQSMASVELAAPPEIQIDTEQPMPFAFSYNQFNKKEVPQVIVQQIGDIQVYTYVLI
ncbi:MAG: hypothetical protein JW774_04070 [Candidatus Aureabacteria bacterium]|nr:hypothetical protein [Candidatus Auribacterota bacterium]